MVHAGYAGVDRMSKGRAREGKDRCALENAPLGRRTGETIDDNLVGRSTSQSRNTRTRVVTILDEVPSILR